MHSITGKLNKDAQVFQAGDSTGFSIRLGVKARNPKTKEDEWANYQAVIFAKSPGQIDFYQSALIEGSVIEVSCEALLIESFDGQNGTVLTLNMINARLGYVHSSGAKSPSQAPQSAPQKQGGFAPQAPQQAPDKKIPTPEDMAWVKAINEDGSYLKDITDPTYRAYIESIL